MCDEGAGELCVVVGKGRSARAACVSDLVQPVRAVNIIDLFVYYKAAN